VVRAEPTREDLLTSLRELVEALDRRMPQLQRVGEVQIAADAARLRALALDRIESLRQSS
jgi:hypothetical protein